MKFCTKCGTPIPEDDSFCTNCGTPVPKEAAYTDPAVENIQPTAPTVEEDVYTAPVEESEPKEEPVTEYAAPQTSAFMPASGLSDALDEASADSPDVTPTAEQPYIQPGYAEYSRPFQEKSKKPLLFALIGGVAAIVALGLILCLFLCGGNDALEWGMSKAQVVDAMTSAGFLADDVEDADEFFGYVEKLGEVEIDCEYTDAGKLFSVSLSAEHPDALLDYAEKHFGNYKEKTVLMQTFYMREDDKTLSVYIPDSGEIGWISYNLAPVEALEGMNMILDFLE